LNMSNVLILTLYKKWFDLIAQNLKKIEYRDKKSYWRKRLFVNGNELQPKRFDEIVFVNGYGRNRPRIRIQFSDIKITDKYEIILGDRIV